MRGSAILIPNWPKGSAKLVNVSENRWPRLKGQSIQKFL